MLKKFTLGNGIKVVFENIPYVKSASIGIWVRTGSCNENIKTNGISHFIEHMLFKGTKKRNASQIAESIDNIGGQINAFTGKECTCYYAKTLDEHIDIAMDVLSDMLFNSVFSGRNVALEKRVIIEEISMYEDSPEELVHDILSETVWGGSPIGYPILGTRKSLRGINRDMIIMYMNERYIPSNMVISVVGNFDADRLEELLKKYFERQVTDYHAGHFTQSVNFRADTSILKKETEQVHMCIGFEGVKNGDDNIYPLLAVNNILGGGMSSRLFQKIREKRALVYSIYSYPTSYNSAGLLTIYAGMRPENINEVTALIDEEIYSLLKKGIKPRELERSKEQMKGNFILGLESTSGRMNSIGKSELLLGYVNTPEEILRKIDAITMEDVERVGNSVLKPDKRGVSIVGNIA